MRRALDVALVALVVLGAVLSACGRSKGSGSTGTTVPTTISAEAAAARFPDDQIVWQSQVNGGLVSQVAWAARRPSITIYGDGRIYLVKPSLDPRYDQPIPLRYGKVSRDQLAAFIGRAEASGLFDGGDFGRPATPDLTLTDVHLHGLDGVKELDVYALGGRFDADVSEAQAERREELRQLLSAAEALLPTPQPFSPERVRVLVLPDNATFEAPPDDTPDEVPAWPGAAPDSFTKPAPAELGSATISGCGEVTGDAAAKLFDAADANPSPHWTAGGRQRSIVVVALLPGEAACG